MSGDRAGAVRRSDDTEADWAEVARVDPTEARNSPVLGTACDGHLCLTRSCRLRWPTRHTLVLLTRPPEGLDLLYEGVKRHRPPPAGAVSLVPAVTPVMACRGHKDSFHIHLEPGLRPGWPPRRSVSTNAADAPAARRPRPPAPRGRHVGGV